jgi:AIPR protein
MGPNLINLKDSATLVVPDWPETFVVRTVVIELETSCFQWFPVTIPQFSYDEVLLARGRIEMETKVKFRDELKAYVRHELDIDIERLPPTKQSKAMTRFYVQKVKRISNPGLVPTDPDDLETCLVDGENDCGVDFLSRSDGTVLIVQAKFRGSGVNEKLEDIVGFCDVLRRIHPEMGKKYKKSQKLQEALIEIDWDNDTFELVFISLGRFGPNLRVKEEEGPTLGQGLEDLADRCELALADETDLNVQLREAISAGETGGEPIRLSFVPNEDEIPWITLDSSHGRRVYVGFVRGSEIAEVYRPRNRRFRLFAQNIRDWVGDTGTNKGIVATAENRPGDFLFFNNGISAVATSIEENPDERTLSCKNFSIINGAQTVRSLFKAQIRNATAVKATVVMVRISTFSLGKEPAFLEEVTRFNNTQNKISVSDFRSNDAVQKDLAAKFAEMKRGGTYFWYKNKRSRERKDRHAIEMEEFAKTVHAFQYGPHDMYGGTARLFDSTKDGRYSHIFGDGSIVWMTVPDDRFHVLCGIWFICEYVRELWKQEKEKKSEDQRAEPALERRYMVYFAVGQLLRMNYRENEVNLDDDLQKLGKPKWTERDGPEKPVLRELANLAFAALVKAYETASRSPDFRHRNWFRDRRTLGDIDSDLTFIRKIRSSGRQDLPLLVPSQ